MLDLKNISFSYAQYQLFKLDHLSLKKGELVVLLGLNGSGKSTFLRCIADLENPQSGSIHIDGKSIGQMSKRELATQLSLVLTDSPYPYNMPVEEFVAFGRYPYMNWLAQRKQEDVDAINRSLEECRIEHLRYRSMGGLSDGERQRTMIARALSQQAKLLLLDEPTTHLDGINTMNILSLLKRQAKAHGKSIIYSSHKIAESLQLADKLWIIHRNELKEWSKEEFSADLDIQKALFGEHFSYDSNSNSFLFNMDH